MGNFPQADFVGLISNTTVSASKVIGRAKLFSEGYAH